MEYTKIIKLCKAHCVIHYTAGFRSATWPCCENPAETLPLSGYLLKTPRELKNMILTGNNISLTMFQKE
jgi:hypothetical protein